MESGTKNTLVGANKNGTHLDIGFWFPRPDRGALLAQELRSMGHRVIIYHYKDIPGNQTHVRYVPYNWFIGLNVLLRSSHDVYYTPASFLPVIQLCVGRYLMGRPYVYTLNGAIWAYYDERCPPSVALKWKKMFYPILLRLALQGAGAVVANSRFLAESLSQRFPKLAPKISSIYNGIDFGAIETGTSYTELWPSGNKRVISVVTANFFKKVEGILLLLQAFQLISERESDVTFLMVAKNDEPSVIDQIRKYLQRLPDADRIQLVVNRQDVPDLLAAAHLFMYATPADSSDSLPRVLLEAQAAGVPTVVTNTTGCAEVVLNNKTGRVVQYESNALAQAALVLIRDREEAMRLAKEGKRLVRKRFQWDSMAKSYEELFFRASGISR